MISDKTQGCGSLIIVLVVSFIIFGMFILTRKERMSDIHPMLDQVRENFAKINPVYSKIPLKEGSSSYTENKNVITLCIKDPESGGYYDMNTIMYVALHELAHVVTKSQHHTDEFKKNFNILLRKGAKIGIYDPRIPIPSTYCGVNSDE